jgi:hypothetical protein
MTLAVLPRLQQQQYRFLFHQQAHWLGSRWWPSLKWWSVKSFKKGFCWYYVEPFTHVYVATIRISPCGIQVATRKPWFRRLVCVDRQLDPGNQSVLVSIVGCASKSLTWLASFLFPSRADAKKCPSLDLVSSWSLEWFREHAVASS